MTDTKQGPAAGPSGSALSDRLGRVGPWEPIGWGVSGFARSGIAHLWLQHPMKRDIAYSLCGNVFEEHKNLDELSEALRKCARCQKANEKQAL